MPKPNLDYEMPPLTKRELITFLAITIIGFLMFFGALWALDAQQSCWEKYHTEQTSILSCEEPNK